MQRFCLSLVPKPWQGWLYQLSHVRQKSASVSTTAWIVTLPFRRPFSRRRQGTAEGRARTEAERGSRRGQKPRRTGRRAKRRVRCPGRRRSGATAGTPSVAPLGSGIAARRPQRGHLPRNRDPLRLDQIDKGVDVPTHEVELVLRAA